MMFSGIGAARRTSPQLGIASVLDRPGVGANLHDHLQLRMIFKVSGVRTLNEMYSSLPSARDGRELCAFRRGPLTMAPSQLGAFTRSDPSQRTGRPIQYHIQPLSLDKFGDTLHPFPAFTASVPTCGPTSRGWLKLNSTDPAADARRSIRTIWRRRKTAHCRDRSASREKSLRRPRSGLIRRWNICRGIALR